MFKLGLCSVTFRNKTIDQVVGICRGVGLEGIEWGGDIHLKPGSPREFVEEVRQKCRDAGLATPSYGSYFDVLEQPVKHFEYVLNKARILEADTIRVWPGWVRPENVSEDQRRKIIETSREIASMAAEHGIRVGFEFHDHTCCEGGDNAMWMLDLVDHPNMHTYYQLIRPRETDWNLENLEKVYHRLAYIHVQANDYQRNLPLADFRELWEEIIRRLKQKGYEGWLLFEFNKDNSVEQLEEDAALIRSFIEGA